MDTGNQLTTSQGLWRGHLAMLVANIGWGVMSPIAKAVLLSEQITPIALSAFRIGGGAILFWLFTPFMPKEKVERRDFWLLLLASFLIISCNQGLFIVGIGFTSPIDSAVMSSLTPVMTMILAAWVLGFPITRLKSLGVSLGLTGALLMVVAGGGSRQATNPALGDLMCFSAQVCAALYFVFFTKLIQRYSAFTLMKWMFTFAAVTYIPLTLPWTLSTDFAAIDSTVWLEVTYIIVVATFLSFLLLPYSQRYLRPTVITMYNYLQPVMAALFTALLGVGEFGPVKIAATLLIFVGVWCVNKVTAAPSRVSA